MESNAMDTFTSITQNPNDPFTILEPQNPLIDKLYVVRKRQSTDLKALHNILKESVGKWAHHRATNAFMSSLAELVKRCCDRMTLSFES